MRLAGRPRIGVLPHPTVRGWGTVARGSDLPPGRRRISPAPHPSALGLWRSCHLCVRLPADLSVFWLLLPSRWQHWLLLGLRVGCLSIPGTLREMVTQSVSYLRHPAGLPFPATPGFLGAASSLENLHHQLCPQS